MGGVEAVSVITGTVIGGRISSTLARVRRLAARDVPVWDEAHARQVALERNTGAPVVALQGKTSRIVPLTLAIAFLLLACFEHWQNGVIREQASVLARYENGARIMARLHESAILRADIAMAAYDRCRGLRGVAAP